MTIKNTISTESTLCIFCGRNSSDEWLNGEDYLWGVEGRFSYTRCDECGLLYMNPRVVPTDAGKLYPEDYGPHLGASALGAVSHGEASRPGVTDRVKRFLRRHFFDRLKGVRLNREAYCTMARSDSRALDVGCGSGAYLDDLRKETGCDVLGVDFSEAAVETAFRKYGVKVLQGKLSDVSLEPDSFDLVTAWWLIEHVPNPGDVISEMVRLTKAGGRVVVGTPNSRSLNARLFGRRWYHLDCPRHYHLWTPETFQTMFENNGLELERLAFDRSPWGLLGSLQFLVFGRSEKTRFKNLLRKNAALGLVLLPLTFLVALCGASDVMVAHCRKPMK
ncbi:MAG: class I SAM-dependent methyltransferase [Lentisphaeria bacterium]